MSLGELRAHQHRLREMREQEIERMEEILNDQRHQLNEYEREKIKENLLKLQRE